MFIQPELCKLLERPPSGAAWGHEVKFDGYRIQLRVVDGTAGFRTRKGLDWTAKFSGLKPAAGKLPDSILDGEIVVLDSAGAPDFGALQAALTDHESAALIYFAFDALYIGAQDLRDMPLRERKLRLKALLASQADDAAVRYVEHFEAAGEAILRSACRMSLEGIVSKRLDAPYRSGRTGAWTKSKCRAGQEVVLGGWAQTDGRFRSLLAGVYHDGRLMYAGRVGTGFGAHVVGRLLPVLKKNRTERSPFAAALPARESRDVQWLKPVLVAEVEFAGWTSDGLVRQASFKGLRDDKPALQVKAEKPVKRKDLRAGGALSLPKPARKSPRKTVTEPAVVMGVSISKPDKVLWPAAGPVGTVTKLALAQYYEAVSGWIFEHTRGRPCSIVRAPEGIDGEHFFQRHAMPGTSSLLALMPVARDPKPYLAVDRPEGLAALAQIAALEIHPWNCIPGDPEIPGRLIFDLDPAPDVKFEEVVAAALELKDRLEAVGLNPFCKTTGGKGLHVVTPLAAGKAERATWPEAKSFAKAMCALMVADSPNKYLLTAGKAERRGKIFLDYLRNDRMATAVRRKLRLE